MMEGGFDPVGFQNVFKRYPVASEKQSQNRKTMLYRGESNPGAIVRELAKQFFQPKVAENLSNSITSMMILNELIRSPDVRGHMQNLSDFVALCVAFVYIQPAKRQAICFLKEIVTAGRQYFQFDSDDKSFLLDAIIKTPPVIEKDVEDCGEIIEKICETSVVCIRKFLERIHPSEFTPAQKPILVAACKRLQNFANLSITQEEAFELARFAKGGVIPSKKGEGVIEPTPTAGKVTRHEIGRKITNFFNACQRYQKIIWLILTIVVIFVVIN
jgi:hypothetical protein